MGVIESGRVGSRRTSSGYDGWRFEIAPLTLRFGAAERAKEMCRFFVGHGTGCEGGAERGACRSAAENASFKLVKSLNQRRNGADCQKAAVGGMILPYAEEGTQ